MSQYTGAENAFAVYRGLLWFLGVWPLEKENPFQIFRYLTAAVFQASFMLHTAVEIYLNNGEISDMVDVWLFFASATLAFCKHAYLHKNQRKLAANLEFYIDDWQNTKSRKSLKIMTTHLNIYKYQFIIYNSIGYIGTTLFLLRTLVVNFLNKSQLDEGEEFEYQFICKTSYLPQQFLEKNYIIIMTVQYMQCMYVCTSGACTDCFFFGLLLHLGAQFEILKNSWTTLTLDGSQSKLDAVKITDSRMGNKVNELVMRHQSLLLLGKNLEISFNRVVLIQLLTSIILICMSGCSIIVASGKKDYLTMMLSTNCISFMITESFIYGYASDYLMTCSVSVAGAAYSCDWNELAAKRRKDILFVIKRAIAPLGITAGKFFYVTRNTIVQLVKSSFSYISVLRLAIEVSKEV